MVRICCRWNANGTGKLTCPINSKLDVTKLNVVVKLVSVLQLIEIKHWKGILWLYSCTRNIVCRGAFFFFSKRYPKVYGGRLGKGSTSPLESFFDSPQISVSWKSKSIAKKNVIKLFIERANANHPTIKVYYWSIMMRNRNYILGHNGL